MMLKEKLIVLEIRKIINNLSKNYSVPDLAKIFNISKSTIYNDLSFEIRNIAVQERLSQNKEPKVKENAWSHSIIQYENYFFSNILQRMGLLKLRFDNAPKQKWMQQHGFSPFINALNEKKLQSYGINNVTNFWKYLGLILISIRALLTPPNLPPRPGRCTCRADMRPAVRSRTHLDARIAG